MSDSEGKLLEVGSRGLPATASTTAATLTTAATTTAAAGTFGFGTRFVYVQSSSTNLRAVQRSDRFFSVLGACHFDKAKSARASSVAIGHDADSIHLAVNFEKLTQLFFGRVEIQVSNKDVLHANASGVSYLSVGASAGKQAGHLSPSWNRGRSDEQSNAGGSIAGKSRAASNHPRANILPGGSPVGAGDSWDHDASRNLDKRGSDSSLCLHDRISPRRQSLRRNCMGPETYAKTPPGERDDDRGAWPLTASPLP
jgi:hypothetical protein